MRAVVVSSFLLAALSAGCDTALGEPRDAAVRDVPAADVASFDAGPVDAPVLDAGTDAGTPDAPPPPPTGRVIYAADRLQSPITDDVAERLRSIATTSGRRGDVVSRIGDSITVSPSFLTCFGGTRVQLDGRDALQATIDHFDAGSVGGESPFTRASLCATSGWSASAALAGTPSPLSSEIAAAHPGYASLMFGTNDVGFRDPSAYAGNMLDIVDQLLAAGAVPVLSSIPPRDDSATADARVPLFGAIVRGIAQGRGVPFVDLHAALLPLAGHGLGGDGVHPNVSSTGGCDFTAAGLGYGYNQRNLLVITALDRARRVIDGEPAPDAEAPRMVGEGSDASPFLVTGATFTDLRDTSAGFASRLSGYACSAANEGGPEVLYRLELTAPATIHAWVFDRGMVDVDVHLLDASGTAAGCLARNDAEIRHAAAPGTYWISVDSFVDGAGATRSGEYLLVVRLE